jgi:acyl-CoA thioesterase-1
VSRALRRIGPGLALALALLPATAGAQTTPPQSYIAFGDSITFGYGDNASRGGYPGRLQTLLNSRGVTATVVNAGLSNETTGEALSRINRVLNAAASGDVLLLMEGTNDVNAQASAGAISNETIVANLDEMALRAEARGQQVVHATVIPRLPSANFDGTNRVTADLAGKIRELAFNRQRRLADPFQVFFHQTANFTQLYLGGTDKLHPNAAGYDLLAQVFADVLTNVDSVAPVTGLIEPSDDAQNVPATASIRIDLFDFGAGIDLANTRLVINDQVVETPISGSARKVEIRYTPPAPFAGVVIVDLRSRDLANPPHSFDSQVTQFVVSGTTFLRGDIDRNGRVDGVDLLAFAPSFGARRSDAPFRTFADFNGDGVINGQDLAVLAANFGRSSF